MTNWRQLAQAEAPGIPEEQLNRIAPLLEALETSFQKIIADLPHDTEAAIDLRLEAE